MKETDTRIQYTKSALKGALLRILKTKPIAKVTIKELCEQAHLNRGTFYLHYCEPNDVLKEIEEDFISEHLGHFSPYLQPRRDMDQLAQLFYTMFRKKELFLILMGRHGAPQFQDRIKELLREPVLSAWKVEFPDYNEADLAFVYGFVYHGAMHAILTWLQNEDGITAAQIGQRLDRLGHYAHLAIREFR